MKIDIQLLQQELFQEGANTYAILDGASVPGLLAKLQEWEPEYVCLYRGELKPDLAEVAPYLVRLGPDTEVSTWILSAAWGSHWGIFATANADLNVIRQHFRRFLTVHDEKGRPLLFRFYDPRVLGVYLSTCDATELRSFFGPVCGFFSESQESGKLMNFRMEKTSLSTQIIQVS